MDGAQFAKMLSDKHLFELNRMEYKYSTVSVKEFAELLRQNFAQPLPLTDFSGNKLFYLPNLAQISTNGMKQLLSVPVSGQNFGLSAMTEEIYATFQIESIRSTRSSIRYILDGYAPRDEQEARIYGMKRGLEFIADRQNTITEENLHYLYQISTGIISRMKIDYCQTTFIGMARFLLWAVKKPDRLPAERLPGAMKCLVDFANANDGINELHKAAILHFAFAYYHPYFDGNGRTARLFHLWYLVQQGYPAALFTPFSRYIAENKDAYYKAYERVERNALISGYTDVTPFCSTSAMRSITACRWMQSRRKLILRYIKLLLRKEKSQKKNGCSGSMFCLLMVQRSLPQSSWKRISETLRMQPFGRL